MRVRRTTGRRTTGRTTTGRTAAVRTRATSARRENLHGIDLPVRLLELFRVLCNESLAALKGIAGVAHRTFSILAKDATGPVTTEIRIKDELLLRETFCKIAITLQMSHGSAETRCIGHAVGERFRGGASREVPDLDEIRRALHGVNPTTLLVEGSPSRAIGALDDAANGARGLTTFGRSEIAGHILFRDCAGSASVQDDFVTGVLVDALDDIDLAVLRPAGTDGPERWPCTADTPRHVGDVNHVQPVVVEPFALYPYGVTTNTIWIDG